MRLNAILSCRSEICFNFPTPITNLAIKYKHHPPKSILIKRDDQWRAQGQPSSEFYAGNKFRKLWFLRETTFKDKSTLNKKVVSHGGNQSNAMLSLAALAKEEESSIITLLRYQSG